MADIKFCGLTRPEDAMHAVALGAKYVGVIFADSQRQLTDEAALAVFAGVPMSISRVGVFGDTKPEQIAARADHLGLDVVQLHGDPRPRTIARVRRRWSGRVWAVQRVKDAAVPDALADLFDVADGVVLDARVSGKLGGTGVALPWEALRERIEAVRSRPARFVLAGGLSPENVGKAIGVLSPDVVDVSSGVESAIGVKDHDKMRAFRDAVLAVAGR